MKSTYVVTMWSGGRAAKKWKTHQPPVMLSSGYGVEFVNEATRLKVQLVGNISIEEYESGKEDFESSFFHDTEIPAGGGEASAKNARGNIQPLF